MSKIEKYIQIGDRHDKDATYICTYIDPYIEQATFRKKLKSGGWGKTVMMTHYNDFEGLTAPDDVYKLSVIAEEEFVAKIFHEPQDKDAWVCVCGNTPADLGFFTVNSNNDFVEPTVKDWDTNNYACFECGVVIDQFSLNIVGEQNPSQIGVDIYA